MGKHHVITHLTALWDHVHWFKEVAHQHIVKGRQEWTSNAWLVFALEILCVNKTEESPEGNFNNKFNHKTFIAETIMRNTAIHRLHLTFGPFAANYFTSPRRKGEISVVFYNTLMGKQSLMLAILGTPFHS